MTGRSREVADRAATLCDALSGGLVVSCQALPDEPLHGAVHMAAMARAAVLGGAVGIRANGAADIAAIRTMVTVPIIGLEKDDGGEHPVRITPTLTHAERVAAAGADAIALDATADARPDGGMAAHLARVHAVTGRPIVADVSTLEEALAAEEAGADLVATTLSGYTVSSPRMLGPDVALVERCAARLTVPVIAEGRYRDGSDVRAALDAGALCVVIGGAITRPSTITRTIIGAAGAATGPGATTGPGP